MQMNRSQSKICAFLTCEDPSGFFIYDSLTTPHLNLLGWNVVEIPWSIPTDWNQFDAVIIRSTWDYQSQTNRFLRIMEEIDSSTAHLQNPLEIVRWNIQKTYLKQMQSKGTLIVPTLWIKGPNVEDLHSAQSQFGSDWIILKPLVGANSDHVFKLNPSTSSEQIQKALDFYAHQTAMIQPFIPSVVETGEYSLFYFNGEFSHCILKTPRSGDFRVQEEHGGSLQLVQADPSLLRVGKEIIQNIGQRLLYARIDLVILPDGRPALMELELIEPSLYFNLDPDSPRRFAEALDQMMR